MFDFDENEIVRLPDLDSALENFTDPALVDDFKAALTEWREAGAYPRKGTINERLFPLTEKDERRNDLVNAKERTFARIEWDLWQRLFDGDLIAFARQGSPLGDWVRIPSDAWDKLRVRNWKTSIVRDLDGQSLYSVRITTADQEARLVRPKGGTRPGRKGGVNDTKERAIAKLEELIEGGVIDLCTISQAGAAELIRRDYFPKFSDSTIRRHIAPLFKELKSQKTR